MSDFIKNITSTLASRLTGQIRSTDTANMTGPNVSWGGRPAWKRPNVGAGGGPSGSGSGSFDAGEMLSRAVKNFNGDFK